MQKTLEQEFEERVFAHKSAILLASLLKFYKDEQNTGVNIPEWLCKTPEEKTKEHYFMLLADRDIFNSTYDKCWEKYGSLLP